MIIVDRALQRRAEAGNPIRVGMVGAGFMGRGIARQIVRSVPGMRLVAISNRDLARAQQAYAEAGIDSVKPVGTLAELEDCVREGRYAVTEEPTLLSQLADIEAIIEVTGSVDFGAYVVIKALEGRKHVILMNVQLDATLGPILKVHADRHGVLLSATDGDQPGAQVNLFRFVKSIGMKPLLCGNIKGFQDHYRTPTTQLDFARRWSQKPHMVASFADGTEISFEQAVVANATGMAVATRGMLGYEYPGHVDEMTGLYDVQQLEAWGGIVDYVVGAQPRGVFVFATHDDPTQRQYLELFKMGSGPLYSFYTPNHMCHFEVPLSVARVVLLEDVVASPLDGPRVEVVATAKSDLAAGETLDGIGWYMTYGQCENHDLVKVQRLLPMGLAEGCRLKRNIRKDEVIGYDDVDVPPGRLCDRLYEEQTAHFA